MKVPSAPGSLLRVLAWRRLADRPLRSSLAAAGVAAGVAFLFSVTSLNAQLASDVRDTAALVARPGLLQVTPASPGGLPDALAGQLAADPRVVAAAPLLLARSTASSGSNQVGLFVLGVTADVAALAADAMETIEIEQSALPTDTRGVVVSGSLARRLDTRAGRQVRVHASTGIRVMPVAAVVSSPLLDRVNGGMAAVMPLADAQGLFGRTGRVDQILLLARPGADQDALRRDVVAATEGIGVVGSPGETTAGRSADFAAVQLVTNLLGSFVLFVAVVMVFHTMSMATAERRTEIALARSLGASRKQLLLVTLAEAAFLGGAGTAVGLVAGGVLARLVVPIVRYAYGGVSPVDIPADVSLQLGPAMVAAAAGVAAAVLGAVIPARSAARAAPIDAFRPTGTYEWRDPARPAHQLATAAVGAAIFAAGTVVALRDTGSANMSDPRSLVPLVVIVVGALILVPTAIPLAARAAAALLGGLSTIAGRLAGDALRANPRRTTVNVVPLLLPVATVVATVFAFNAGLTEIGRLARTVVAAPLNVDADSYVGGPGGSVASQPLAPAHHSVLEAVPGVRAVLPYENANVSLPDDNAGVIYAIPLSAAQRAAVSDMVRIPRLADDPVAFTRSLTAGEIAASRFAARSLHLRPGSRLTLPTPSGPRVFTVGALFDDWAFQSTFYIDLDTYRAAWRDDGAYRYAIVPTAGTSLDDLRRRVDAAVTAAAMPAQVHTRGEAVAQLEATTASLLPLTRGISLACLIFAALALANAAFTAVTERRWTFALQRTLGMTRRQITRSLALEAVAIGVIGAIGGAVVGLGIGVVWIHVLALQIATTLPRPVPWALVAAATVLGVAVAVGATHYPRRIAKRLTIIEALRFE